MSTQPTWRGIPADQLIEAAQRTRVGIELRSHDGALTFMLNPADRKRAFFAALFDIRVVALAREGMEP